jgi:hypothetical protein
LQRENKQLKIELDREREHFTEIEDILRSENDALRA